MFDSGKIICIIDHLEIESSIWENFYHDNNANYTFVIDNNALVPINEIEKHNGKIIRIDFKRNLKKELRKIFSQDDYTILEYHLQKKYLFILKLAKKYKIRIRILHPYKIISKRYVWYVRKYATAIFSPCDKITKSLGKLNVYEIKPAINLKQYEFNSILQNKLREKLNILSDTLVIGALTKLDNPFLLMVFKEIVNINSNVFLLVEKDYLEHWSKKINEYKINDKVKAYDEEFTNLIDIFIYLKDEVLPESIIKYSTNKIFTVCSTNVADNLSSIGVKHISLKYSSGLWAKIILNKYQLFKIAQNKVVEYPEYATKKVSSKLLNIYQELKQIRVLHINAKQLEVDVPKIDDYPNSFKVLFKEINNLKNLKKIVNDFKPNVIHAHDYESILLAAKLRNHIAYVWDIHDELVLSNRLINKADVVLVNCPNMKNKLSKNDKIIDIGYYFNPTTILSQVKKNSKKKYDICSIGSLEPDKDPAKFIRLVSELKIENPKVLALWVGDGSLKDEFLAQVEQFGLNKNIVLKTDIKEKWSLLNEAKIFVLTSDEENNALVVYGALLLGIPCLIPPVKNNSWTGKACKEVKDISEYVENIHSFNKFYQAKSNAARSQAEKLENKDNYLEKILKIYINIVKS